MTRRPFASPRSTVVSALTLVLALAGLLAVRLIGLPPDEPRAEAADAAASIPEPRAIVLDRLAIPCWSCPEAATSSLGFHTDLDLLAPLGTGKSNAAAWYADFTTPDGARARQADAIMARRVDHPSLGKILPAGDPFLAEAQPWLDQSTMRFYPDVYPVAGFQTKVPNLMLALTLARSFVARGQAAADFDDAMADFRRAVRLGRLLRQDDVMVIDDLIGLAAIRLGLDAIYERARAEGRMDLALAAAVAAGEAPAQKLLSAARMTSAEVIPYLQRGAGGASIVLPDDRFDSLRRIALESPDRRFRVIAAASLSLVASFGSPSQRTAARDLLATLAASDDPVIAANARWHLANPIDGARLDQLLAP